MVKWYLSLFKKLYVPLKSNHIFSRLSWLKAAIIKKRTKDYSSKTSFDNSDLRVFSQEYVKEDAECKWGLIKNTGYHKSTRRRTSLYPHQLRISCASSKLPGSLSKLQWHELPKVNVQVQEIGRQGNKIGYNKRLGEKHTNEVFYKWWRVYI